MLLASRNIKKKGKKRYWDKRCIVRLSNPWINEIEESSKKIFLFFTGLLFSSIRNRFVESNNKDSSNSSPFKVCAKIGQGDSTFELLNCDENIYLHLDVNFVGDKFRIFNESKVKYEVHSFIESENRRL